MPVCTSFSLCVKHMVKCMHCFPLLHSSYSSSCSFCVLFTCLCEFKCIGIICQWFGNSSRVGGACETSGDGHVKVKMVAMVQRAFHLMFYSMSQYIEALNNLRCFLLSFIPLSPCPSFSRQRLMYPIRKCWNSGSFIDEGSYWRVRHINDHWTFALVVAASLCVEPGYSVY